MIQGAFPDPEDDCVEVVDHADVRFTKAPEARNGMGLDLNDPGMARRQLADAGMSADGDG